MIRARRPSDDHTPAARYLLEYEADDSLDEKNGCCQKYKTCVVTGIICTILLLVVFIVIFVVLPVVFMHSTTLQVNVLFQKWYTYDDHEFTNFRKYGIDGARNFYVPITPNISLGVWHLLPLQLVHESVEDENYNYVNALLQDTHPVLLYFHEARGNRIMNKYKYTVLRRFFHIITFDYRSYGDSSPADLFEEGIVNDCVLLYHWLRMQTKAPIYVWGHSMGSAIATHTVANLRNEGIVPKGLFLESPFTSIREELPYYPVTYIFSWLVWFEATITEPVEANGFFFKTNENILSVNCPILIVHAADDNVVPYSFSEKLFKIAKEMRDEGTQGSVTLHVFPKNFGYGHANIYEARELSDYISNHIEICKLRPTTSVGI